MRLGDVYRVPYQLPSSEDCSLSRSYHSNYHRDMKLQLALLTAAACVLGATAGIPVLGTYAVLYNHCSSASNNTVRSTYTELYRRMLNLSHPVRLREIRRHDGYHRLRIRAVLPIPD